jgi:hypothetical protein
MGGSRDPDGRSCVDRHYLARFRSAWMGIIVHSLQSVFAIVFVLVAVLD